MNYTHTTAGSHEASDPYGFLTSQSIGPVLVKANHGHDYAIFYKNEWKDGKSRKLFQKMVGRIDKENNIEFGRKFLSEFPFLKGVSGKLVSRTVRLLGLNLSTKEPPMSVEDQRKQFLAELDQDTRMSAGAAYLFLEIAKQNGMQKDLETVFGPGTSKSLLSLAIFFASDPGAAASEYPIYSRHTLLPGAPLDSERVSELFEQLTNPDIVKYLHLRVDRAKSGKDGPEFWSFDTTSISSYSETIAKVSYGHSKEDASLPQINLGLIVSEGSGEPLYYKILDGSMSDPIALRQMLVDTSNFYTSSVNLVLDRAFSTPRLLNLLYQSHLGFLCGSKSNLNYCKSLINNYDPILEVGGLSTFLSEFGIQAKTKETSWFYNDPATGAQEKGNLFIHVYLDESRAAQEKEITLKRLAAVQKKLDKKQPLSHSERELLGRFFKKEKESWTYDQKAWEVQRRQQGIFVLVSNTVKDASEALRLYRQRDIIEKNFNNYKERCAGRRMRCQEKALEGKVFTLFLSLTLLMNLKLRFYKVREQLSDLTGYPDDVPDLLRTLRSVCVTTRKSEDNRYLYWDMFPKKLRETLERLDINLPPRFIT